MDYTCHQADSEARYKLYFDLVHSKMEEYDVLPGNTYNMDEKDSMIGQTERNKKVQQRELGEEKED
jgi:hypothetical protein